MPLVPRHITAGYSAAASSASFKKACRRFRSSSCCGIRTLCSCWARASSSVVCLLLEGESLQFSTARDVCEHQKLLRFWQGRCNEIGPLSKATEACGVEQGATSGCSPRPAYVLPMHRMRRTLMHRASTPASVAEGQQQGVAERRSSMRALTSVTARAHRPQQALCYKIRAMAPVAVYR